jgi:hypothetical protein
MGDIRKLLKLAMLYSKLDVENTVGYEAMAKVVIRYSHVYTVVGELLPSRSMDGKPD